MSAPPLLVGTADGLHRLGGPERLEFAGRAVTALARGAGRWWCLLDGREVWTTRAGRWHRVAASGRLQAHCLLATGEGALVGAAGARLLRLRRGALARVAAFDRVPGRDGWFTPWGGPPAVRSLARARDGTLFANVHVGGIVRSRDRGRSWQPTVEIETDVHEVAVHPRRARVVLAASAVGLGISRDGGDAWAFERRGFHALYQRAVAVAGEVVLVSASRSERGQQAAVYRRALGDDGPFARCATGLPRWFGDNVDTACLAGHGRHAAIGAPDGTVFVSADHGRSFRVLRAGLPRVRCLAFAARAGG